MAPTNVHPFQPCPVCPKCGTDARAFRRYEPSLDVLAFTCGAHDGCGHRWASEPGDAPRERRGMKAAPRSVELPDDADDGNDAEVS